MKQRVNRTIRRSQKRVQLCSKDRLVGSINDASRRMWMMMCLLDGIGQVYSSYMLGLQELNDHWLFSRADDRSERAMHWMNDVDKCISQVHNALNDMCFKRDSEDNFRMLTYSVISDVLEKAFNMDASGNLVKGCMDVVYLPGNLSNALKASPVYAPYIHCVSDDLQKAIARMDEYERKEGLDHD